MKKILLTNFFYLAGIVMLFGQLPNGSTSPDFSEVDINGGFHNLYSYLDDEKVVFLDFSATWCGPCWSYHNGHAFNDVYADHPDHVQPIMIEGDAATNVDCLYGLSSCNNTTLGNWVAGTTYPIIDAANLSNTFAIAFYPTIYGVCPDKKIYEIGQPGAGELWEFAQECSAPSMEVLFLTHVDCFGNSTGEIILDVQGGISPFTFEWSNGANTPDISNIPAGSYEVTVTGSLGGTKTLGPIIVEEPSAPLETDVISVVNEGCGFGGSIEVITNGGTPGYSYQWNTGETDPIIFNLTAGTYSVTTTDLNLCTHEVLSIVVEPPAIPVASAAAPSELDCINSSFHLDGTGSSEGTDYEYLWVTGDGNIVSGSNTLNECLIDAPGTYQLFITNLISSCITETDVMVTANTTPPISAADAPVNLDCNTSTVELSGLGSDAGSNIEYLWTTIDGNIVSGATTLTPEVDEEGIYTLVVTNNDNGCTADADAHQEADTAPPNASADGGELNCVVIELEIEGGSTTPGVTYEWDGPAGFTSTDQNPEVTTAGTYTLTVTNPDNGCTKTAVAEVTANTSIPTAEAEGGLITCVASSVTLSGSSTTPGVTYEWTGPNGFTSTDQNPVTNEAGAYTLTVTGANGCEQEDNAIVNENTALPTSEAGANAALNCNASSVVLNGSGSSNGNQYTYLWTTTDGNIVSGETTLTPTVDAVGSYSLLVTNTDNGCESNDAAAVSQTPPVAASISASTNVDCHGSSSGSASAAATGGNGAYTYAWSNGSTEQTATNLSAGAYTVVVTDEDNCTSSENVTITEPTELEVTTNSTAQSAPGVNDGSASASPTGGTGTYTYSWSNGETTAMINNLAPGTYTVVVKDANGCEETQTVTVNEFGCAISAATLGEDVSCFGATDGMASIDLSNAVAPFTYEWSNGETTQSIADLPAGTYSVTATDNNDCEIISSVAVGTPTAVAPNATSTGETSAGAGDGTATANPTGGTGPFTYQWSNGETTQAITNLPVANYTVIITDSNGCTAEQTVPVAPFGCTISSATTSSNISCFGENDGQATVTLNNGLPPFTYEWSNGETTPTISNLAPGTYIVDVVDAVNCPTTQEVVITEPSVLEAETTVLTNADCGMSNGSASVDATGGNGNYTYEWSNGETTATISNLAGGTYTVLVTDDNNCTTQKEVVIAVDDTIDPTVMTQNVNVELGSNGMADITPQDVDGGSSDNCAIAEMSLDVSSFDCSSLGQQEVMLTVVDEAGNSSSSMAIVNVTDMTDPQIEVVNLNLSLDANGEATITPGMVDGGSTDNCGIEERMIDVSNFTCDNIGQNAVVLTVMDASGNSSAGTAIVTVEDKMGPTVTCPDNMVLSYCDPVGVYDVDASDNCSTDLMYQYSHPSGSTFPTGETSVEIVVTDEYENATNCGFKVTVPDTMIVEGAVANATCFGDTDGSIEAVVEGGAEGYTYEWSNGETTSSISDLAPGTYDVIVTDADGCSETQSFEVTEPTAVAAEVVSVTNETLNDMNGAIDITPTGGTGGYVFNWRDEAGNIISNDEDISGLSAGNYNVEVIDDNGCATIHTFTIQSVVSIVDYEMARKIKLFPNPTTGLVTMELEDINASSADIHVFDVTGKMAIAQQHANIVSGQFKFDMSQSASGIYIVRILIENSVVTKRLMVSH